MSKSKRKRATVDFETEAIDDRPRYPPKPVGVAIRENGRSRYLSWGHRGGGNNCTVDAAVNDLKRFWRDPDYDLVFHHGKFDVDVAETHLGLRPPEPERYHDTLFLLFLSDPHARSLSLKPSAERVLGLPPDEQDALRDWLLEHRPVPGITKTNFGAHIAEAPATVVGPYARGDVDRTEALYLKLLPEIEKRRMEEAYLRERRLMPILLRNERDGLAVDVPKLAGDVVDYERVLVTLNRWLWRKLGDSGLNLDSDEELADALDAGGFVTAWEYTEKEKKRKTSMKVLKKYINHLPLLQVLAYRSKLVTFLSTFMRPWLEMAVRNGGRIHTSWNQVRGPEGGGARTGRQQSTPNFQNIPKKAPLVLFPGDRAPADYDGDVLWLPAALRGQVPQLPEVRGYVVASEGCHLFNRDYSQQELRIMGHFEDGVLLRAYRDDPRLDIHKLAQGLINDMLGTSFGRRPIKNTSFGLIYGMGKDLLAESTGTDPATAGQLKRAYLNIFPGLGDLIGSLKERAAEGKPIRTWGGREYYCEPPSFSEKFQREMDWSYKLINYLIQGSAADCTKQAIINYDQARSLDARFLLSVHDENMGEAPVRRAKREAGILRDAMAAVKFDVDMLSDGRVGPRWTELVDLPEGQ